MYKKNSFDNLPIFRNIINKYGMSNFLDPLTRTILRGHMISYIDSLINSNQPFSLIIIDIDNFKQINDNYGHKTGDEVLRIAAKTIIDIVGDSGLVGRYGGDEFIIVDIVHNDYDSMHKFLEKFYDTTLCGDAIFRSILQLDQINLLLTGTIGTANFPRNAKNFDELFEKADKALYRGKMKGRNCFIIYVEEKHKDIDITKLIKEPLQNTFYNLIRIGESKNTISEKFRLVSEYIKKSLKISHVLIVNQPNKIIEPSIELKIDLEEYIDENDVCAINEVTGIYNSSRELQQFIDNTGIASMMIGRLTFRDVLYGYIIFGESNVQRIWQNEDLALLLFVIKMIGTELYLLDK